MFLRLLLTLFVRLLVWKRLPEVCRSDNEFYSFPSMYYQYKLVIAISSPRNRVTTHMNTRTCTPLSEVSRRGKPEAVAPQEQKLLMILRSVLFSIILLHDNIVKIYFIIYQEVLGPFSILNLQNNPWSTVHMLLSLNFHITMTVIIVFIDEGIYGDFYERSMLIFFYFQKMISSLFIRSVKYWNNVSRCK